MLKFEFKDGDGDHFELDLGAYERKAYVTLTDGSTRSVVELTEHDLRTLGTACKMFADLIKERQEA